MLTSVIAHDLASHRSYNEHSMRGRRNLVTIMFEDSHAFRPTVLELLAFGCDLDQGTFQRC